MPAPPKKSPDTATWLKTHRQEAILGAGGIVVALALYARSKSSASSAAANQAATNQTYAQPVTTADTTGTDVYSGLENQILGLQSAVIGLGTGSGQTPPPPAAAAPAPSSAAAAPGYGQETVNGIEYDVLGDLTGQSSFTGVNVGGGAPVYYQAPGSSSLLTNINESTIAGLPTGTELLTPVANASQIAPTSAAVQNQHI